MQKQRILQIVVEIEISITLLNSAKAKLLFN